MSSSATFNQMQTRAIELREAGELVAARELLESGLRLLNATEDEFLRRSRLGQLWTLGDVCAQIGDLVAAEAYLVEALEVQSPPNGHAQVDALRATVRNEIAAALDVVRKRLTAS